MQLPDDLRHFHLIPDVQRGGRLVEKQHPRRRRRRVCDLRKGGRDDHPLFFAAAQREERTVSEIAGAGCLQRRERGRDVRGPLDFERAEMRITPHQRDLNHAVLKREVRFLWHDGKLSSERGPRSLAKIFAVEGNGPAFGPQRSAQQPH